MDNRKQRTVALNVDLHAEMTGFGAAKTITPAHRLIAKHYSSPLLLGPPVKDDLLEMVGHMFTEEEADLVQHLPPLRPRTAEKVAKLSGRSAAEVGKVLDRLAFTKIVILAAGEPRKYTIIPGTFEMALMTPDLKTRNSWHKKFSEIFERIYDNGYLKDYVNVGREPIRYLPVGPVIKTLNMAWPSDKLEEVLEPYDLFAIGHCQCRVAMQLVGKGCGKATDNCVGFGPLAKPVIDRGMMRKASREEVIEAKKKAELEGSITWMGNEIGDWRGNISCSCCGCCCHALRSLTQLNTPGMISAPHFLPVLVDGKCKLCKKCINICPMDAWSEQDKQMKFNRVRCIGCGLCVTSCKLGALELKAVPEAKQPEASMQKLLLKMAPGYLSNSVRVWAKRLLHA
jgi:electron transport complex protein RnfB